MGRVRDLWHDRRTGARTARYGSGRRWLAVWEVDGRERSRAFDRKVDAERHLTTTGAALLSGSYVDPARGKITVRAYAAAWLAEQVQHRPTTAAWYESHLRNHVFPVLGDVALGAVRRSTVQAIVAGLSRDLAPGTVRGVFKALAILFRAAVRDRLIPASPCDRINLPERTHSPVEPLTVDQVLALAAALPDRYAGLPILGAGTGLRPGELFGLEVDPRRGLDFLRQRVLVRQQLVTMPGAPPYLAPPKTKTSVRDVPAAAETLDRLAEHLAAWPAVEVEVEDRTGPAPIRRVARLAFTNSRGEPIRRTRFNRVWQAAVARADAELVDAERRRLRRDVTSAERAAVSLPASATPHSLRHTYVSLLIAAGRHPKTIQARLGHKSITETMDTYGHLFPDEDDSTRDAIGAAFRRPEPEPERNSGTGDRP